MLVQNFDIAQYVPLCEYMFPHLEHYLLELPNQLPEHQVLEQQYQYTRELPSWVSARIDLKQLDVFADSGVRGAQRAEHLTQRPAV